MTKWTRGRLLGKRCLVTGASRGIGEAIAIAFAREGAAVAVNYRSAAEENEATTVWKAVKEYDARALLVEADVSVNLDVHSMVRHVVDILGGVDVLVNNAGVCAWTDFLELRQEEWDLIQDVNHRGTFLCSQVVAQQMIRQQKPGSIICVSSIAAYTGGAEQAHYNASKAAVSSLVRSMAVALGRYRIRVNAILPGCIETTINSERLRDRQRRIALQGRTALGRLGTPEDLVGAAIYFASEESVYCTGSELVVDGGLLVNL